MPVTNEGEGTRWFQCGQLYRDMFNELGDDPSYLRRCPWDTPGDHKHRTVFSIGEVDVAPGGYGFGIATDARGRMYVWGDNQDYFDHPNIDEEDKGGLREIARNIVPGVAHGGWAHIVTTRAWPPDKKEKKDAEDPTDEEIVREDDRQNRRGVRCFGWNKYGHAQGWDAPLEVVAVAAGERHSLALSAGGKVFAWGDNLTGQLGLGGEYKTDGKTSTDQWDSTMKGARRDPLPMDVPAVSIGHEVKIVGLAAGARHSALVSSAGDVFTVGWGLYGQLGHEDCEDIFAPRRVEHLAGQFAVSVAAGSAHTAAVTKDGALYTWGSNRKGELGTATGDVTRKHDDIGCEPGDTAAIPQLVDLDRSGGDEAGSLAVAVSCGSAHTIALARLETGEAGLFGFGWNNVGQLGVGDYEDRGIPARIRLPENEKGKTTKLRCGWWHTVVGVEEY